MHARRLIRRAPHLVQDKLEPSEALGDLLSRAGDHDAALGMYQRANVPGKVIEGLAAKGDFDALSKFRCARCAPSHSAGPALYPCKWLTYAACNKHNLELGTPPHAPKQDPGVRTHQAWPW